MALQNNMVIKAKRSSMLLVLAPFIILTGSFASKIADDLHANGWLSKVSILTSLVPGIVFGYISLHIIRRMLEKGPGLTISKEGIIDNSGVVSAGAVNWSDVYEVNTSRVILTDCIILKVRNRKSYIQRQESLLRRLWLRTENHFYGSPVNISIRGLKIKFNDLFRILQEYYLSTQVETRTSELKREKDVIQQEKTELVDSINYARRIQTALLPSSATIKENLGESFILFLPKNIISGDFYWVNTLNEWTFFAGCDCTGHGVPGALISIVCNNALNRAVKEFGVTEPAKILDKVTELITESIGADVDVKDGMDASVCAFNRNTRELYWAGANIPLWIARQDTFYELLEFKPDKQPIGPAANRLPYTNHKIEIKKGDILYIFSDGYADQFGGDKGKKLTRKKFRDLLMLQRGISLHDQYNNLLQFHQQYKGAMEQIDDILIMGIRIEQ